MAEVAGKPFLEHVVGHLRGQGISRVLFCIGYMGSDIYKHFGWIGEGMEFDYSIEESLMGTGGGLRHAFPDIQSNTVLVLNGDTYCEFSLEVLEYWHLKWNAFTTRVMYEGLSAGVYLMQRRIIEMIPQGRPVSLEKEFLPSFFVHQVHTAMPFLDIGTPERYAAAEEFLVQHLH
jgi:NDP-sugar pyrophosphorylase family protein